MPEGDMSNPHGEVISHAHYAYLTRKAIELFNRGELGNVVELIVEPEYGYTTRLTYDDGSFRFTYGNDPGLNNSAASELAGDKGHAKFMLKQIGITTPEGREFLLPWWAETIGESQRRRGNTELRTSDTAIEYIEGVLGFPAYIKRVDGSKGIGVMRVDNAQEAGEVIASFERDKVRVMVVEEAVAMPDYRLVILDGTLISSYRRIPLSVTGDGTSTIWELIAEVQKEYLEEGRDTTINPNDTRIARQIGRQDLDLLSILPEEQSLELMTISNLSAGGKAEDVTKSTHRRWRDLGAYIAANFGLRLCGIDLACDDIASPEAHYSVFEVNAAPGLDHYASTGDAQKRVVDDLYARVLSAYPSMK
ncbi:MAG TPA: hypothetical protein VL989_01300 [Candidatus Sulfotelmatobacter sp.]|nr:hypothetical protein [Candidatus Sulfotelmatobacter sp.]